MEFRPYNFARHWKNDGHDVTIAAAAYSHIRQKNPEFDGLRKIEDVGGIRYIWLKTNKYAENGVARFVSMLLFLAQLMLWAVDIAFRVKPDVVFASSTYPLDIFPAWFIAKLARAKLSYEVHDLWPLSPMELGGMPKNHPFILLMQRGEDFAYKVSDRVVSMLPLALDHMVSHGMDRDKFLYVPNGIELAEWETGAAPALAAAFQAKILEERARGAFLICYAGTVGVANLVFPLLDVAKQPFAQPLSIFVVGTGPDHARLSQAVKDRDLTNVHVVDGIPKRQVPTLLSQMDALYIGLKGSPLFRFGISPNKLMDYMMAAKPIIFAVNAGNNMVEEARCGASADPNDEPSIGRAIAAILRETPAERTASGLRGRAFVLEHHDNAQNARRMIAWVDAGAAGSVRASVRLG